MEDIVKILNSTDSICKILTDEMSKKFENSYENRKNVDFLAQKVLTENRKQIRSRFNNIPDFVFETINNTFINQVSPRKSKYIEVISQSLI